MFTTKVEADYRIPGLKYKREPGLLKGKLYTTFPRRFKSGGTNAFRAGLFSFIGLWIVLAIGGDTTSGVDAFLLAIIILFFSYPVFVIYDPGKRIKMTRDELTIGWSRYDLKDVSAFYKIPYYNNKDRIDGYCIGFRNGEREEEILIFNDSEVTLGIVPFLNRVREALSSEAPAADLVETTPAALRSAEF